MSTAVSFAFAAGLLATVNPCGFTMLPSFLTFYLGAHEQDGASRSLLARVREGLTVGAVLSLAFGAVFVVVGLLVSAGLRTVIEVVPWLAVAVAVGLLAVGAAMLAGRHVGLMSASRVTVTPGTSGGYRRVALFGVTYALASLSCTLAVFLVVVGQALAVADPVQLVVVFAAYAAGSASLLIALSVSAALAKGALARAVRRLLPAVNRVSGTLLIGSGIYLLLYWLPSLTDGTPAADSAAARATKRVSATLADFFSANVAIFAALLGLLALLAVAVLATDLSRRRRARDTDTPGGDGRAADPPPPAPPQRVEVGSGESR